MLRLLGIVISIGLADSLNPTTIAPALYLATGERARERVLEFTAAVFAVYLAGGLIIALGPGRLLVSLVPHHRRLGYFVELVAGVAILSAGTLLWRHRARLAERDPPDFDPEGKSSWVLGATITAIELPTAFPYFAAIAAVAGADVNAPGDVLLLVVFNLCFILPLLAIVATLTFGGDHAQRTLGRAREFLHAHWPRVLGVLGVLAGALVLTLGATGLASSSHNDFGNLMQRVHRSIMHP